MSRVPYKSIRAHPDVYPSPYSEAARLSISEYPKRPEVRERIDRMLCIDIWIMEWPSKTWRREKRPRGFYRKLAYNILSEITGMHYVQEPWITPGKLDPRCEWVLKEIYTLSQASKQRKFLIAVAKDAGVWPPPKWWRITRVLLGDNPRVKLRRRRSSRK